MAKASCLKGNGRFGAARPAVKPMDSPIAPVGARWASIQNEASAGIGPLERHITIAIAIPPLFACDACPRLIAIVRFVGVAPIGIAIIALSAIGAVSVSLRVV